MRRAVAILLAGLWATAAAAAPNPMHPAFVPLDSLGTAAARSGRPISGPRTCGACHDAEWIQAHGDHGTASVRADCIACHVAGGRFPEAYEPDDRLRREAISIAAPRDENCAACHGIVHTGRDPLVIPEDFGAGTAAARSDAFTLETGAIWSAQNLSESFLNLSGKSVRAYPWDAHARRLVACIDCHYAANNPLRADPKRARPGFLAHDPRRITLADYLRLPDHRLAAADCRACHDPLAVHNFLPYKARHLDALDCRACHAPELLGPAARAIDSTVVTLDGAPALTLRGYDPRPGETLSTTFARGYAPMLRQEADTSGRVRLAPFNAVEHFAWHEGATGRPVPWDLVRRAYLENGAYAPPVLDALDDDRDGALEPAELRLDAPEKLAAVRARLLDLGASDPRPARSVAYHRLEHGVVAGPRVLRDCGACHAPQGRLAAGLELAPYRPVGVGGESYLSPTAPRGVHVFGHARGGWSDRLGFLFFLAVALAVAAHAGVRYATRARRRAVPPAGARGYLYPAYERIWHWVMAASVLVLIATGLQIHFAGARSLARTVAWHNAFAAVLLVNGFLSLFYHLTTSAIARFFPPRRGIYARLVEQARFYTEGIFFGWPHPSPKTPERRLNPLQQVTYLALLNILLPLQALSGVLIWGASRWPALVASLGGLTLVAPLHNLGAWIFLAFLMLHLYLTTTGRTVLSNLKAMIDGYDHLEHPLAPEEGEAHA